MLSCSLHRFRDRLGVFAHLVQEIRLYPEKHLEYFRMSKDSYDRLLSLIQERITKQDTIMRQAIPRDLRLALTLHYLASGEDFGNLSKHWRVGKSTVAEIVVEVCEAIWGMLEPTYMKQPTSIADWQEISAG